MTIVRSHSELDRTRDKSRSRGGGGLSLGQGISVWEYLLSQIREAITDEAVRMRIAIVPRHGTSAEGRDRPPSKAIHNENGKAIFSGCEMIKRYWKIASNGPVANVYQRDGDQKTRPDPHLSGLRSVPAAVDASNGTTRTRGED